MPVNICQPCKHAPWWNGNDALIPSKDALPGVSHFYMTLGFVAQRGFVPFVLLRFRFHHFLRICRDGRWGRRSAHKFEQVLTTNWLRCVDILSRRMCGLGEDQNWSSEDHKDISKHICFTIRVLWLSQILLVATQDLSSAAVGFSGLDNVLEAWCSQNHNVKL